MKIKKGDTVLIISGKDRGKHGSVLDVFPKEGRLAVEGVNIRKRHVRPRRSGEKGQVVETHASISASTAKLICSKCGKATRTGYRISENTKYRICKKCNQET